MQVNAACCYDSQFGRSTNWVREIGGAMTLGQQFHYHRGAVLMVLGCALITANDAAMKLATSEIPITQAIFLRGLVICVGLFIFRWRKVIGAINRKMPLKQQTLNGVLLALSILLFVSSLSSLSLPIAVTAVYTSPLFVVLLAPALLNEALTKKKIAAVCLGFFGAILVVAPQPSEFTWVIALPLAGALVNALRDIELRRLVPKTSSFVILAFSQVLVTLLYFGPSLIAWSPLSAQVIALLVGASAGWAFGIYLTTEALRNDEASFVIPFKYSGVLWSGVAGLVVWSDIPAIHQLVGAALVIAAGIYLSLRTRQITPSIQDL